MTQSSPPQTSSRRVLIVGCGRLGASVTVALTEQGHSVLMLDVDPDSFDKLPTGLIEDERVMPLVGDGTRQRDLIKASVQESTVFMALTGADTQNALAAQIAKHVFQVPTVICRVDDPSKEKVYNDLGLVTVSAVSLITERVVDAANQ